MKRFRALRLLLLIPLCISCSPAAGQVDSTTPVLCWGPVIIFIIIGLTFGLSKWKLTNVLKDSKTNKPTQIKSVSGTSTFETDKSDTKDKNVANTFSDDLGSKVEAVKRQVQGTIPENITTPINSPAEFSKRNQVIYIHIDPTETKSQAATEIVDVPNGVIIKVTRTRTVEHTVNIEWATTLSGKGEVGVKQLVSASIQGEIQRVKGYVSQQTESVEYEVTLNGEKHNQYKLVWMDIWLKGTANIQDNSGSYSQPFQFRDRTELKVVSIIDS